MDSPILGGVLAFLGGAAVSMLNYWINVRTLKTNPSALASMSFLRQFLNIAYFVAVFLLAKVLPWDYMPLLLGAAIGLTVPSFLLSLRLMKINDSLSSRKDDPSGKGAEPHE